MDTRLKFKCLVATAICFLITESKSVIGQTIFTEGTVKYAIDVSSIQNDAIRKSLAGASQTLTLKGNNARYDFDGKVLQRSLYIDSKTNEYVLISSAGNDKYLTRMNEEKWKQYNKRYGQVAYKEVPDADSTIKGYRVKKAIVTAQDGTKAEVYFTTELQPLIKSYDLLFSGIGGLPLLYKIESMDGVIKYSVSEINLNSVPAKTFAIPETGYKILDIN